MNAPFCFNCVYFVPSVLQHDGRAQLEFSG